MIDLKPCPFCGAPAHKCSWNGGTRIDCSAWDSSDKHTHYVGIGAKTEQEAIEAWNNRAGEQPEVIRCRDCKLRDTEYCNMAHGFMGMKDDDYCSYAERREVSE